MNKLIKTAHNKLRKNLLIGIGHPLLDVSATVEKDFLSKYDLKENDAIVISEKHKNLRKELIQNYDVSYVVGGSIQNTLRIIQWITEVPELTTFFGCVGRDEFSSILYAQAKLDGVNVKYAHNETEPTGTCMVLITGKNRCLCTDAGSSRRFNSQHLFGTTENKMLLDAAEYYYMSGFFFNVSPDVVKDVAHLAAKNNRQFLFNVGAPFVCDQHKEALLETVPYIDVLFGNKSEIEALAESIQLGTKDLTEIVRILTDWRKVNGTRRRIVVLTQGEGPILVGEGDEILHFAVPEIPKDKIVDTNGAGDAFVGGFLAKYIQDSEVDVCVKCGIWAASEIIQRIGCSYGGRAEYSNINV